MHLIVGDHLGSSSVVINHANSRLVERTTYQPYGAVESDYRPAKGKAFREPYKFTGKEEDIEVGATYFGARYYQPYLGRFMSADPLTIHGLGSDLNPYAYVGGRVMTYVDPLGLGLCGVDDPCDEVVVHGSPRGSAERQAELAAARAEASAEEALASTSTPVPPPSIPVPPPSIPVPKKRIAPVTIPFWQALGDPRTWSPTVDPAVIEGFNAGVEKNQVALVGTGITAAISVAVISGAPAAIEIGSLFGGGSAVQGLSASAWVYAGRLAQVFTNLSLGEQGIALGGGGGILFSTKYAGRVAPGRFATPSGRIMAKGSEYATKTVRERILALMRLYGCHTCGTKIGSAVADHQPPNKFNPWGFLQWFYPQCAACSSKQGNEVKKIAP
jgi:RHS repeat-associated protein